MPARPERSSETPTGGQGGRAPRAGLTPYGLARSTEDRVVSGVAGGIGRRLGVDPVIVRLAFVVLSTAGGFGVFVYLLVRALVAADAEVDGPLPWAASRWGRCCCCAVPGCG